MRQPQPVPLRQPRRARLGPGADGACPARPAPHPGIRFWKLCGSGTGEGFTPVPNTAVWAILATWESEAIARARVDHGPVWTRWRAHADEHWTVFLKPLAARGRWSGVAPFEGDAGLPLGADRRGRGALAALTRATIRPAMALKFWGPRPRHLGRHRRG